jgi:hypothetical protein
MNRECLKEYEGSHDRHDAYDAFTALTATGMSRASTRASSKLGNAQKQFMLNRYVRNP